MWSISMSSAPEPTPPWVRIDGTSLMQGDVLEKCLVPMLGADFGISESVRGIPSFEYDIVVLSQSCDLGKGALRVVATCPVFPIERYEEFHPEFRKRKRWNEVRKGRIEGLHLLPCPEDPENNLQALVVDFHEVYSLPYDYLIRRAAEIGCRWRLCSPYLEHLSQAFGRFFMRVGLPSNIPDYS